MNNIQFETVWISYLLMGTMFLRYLVYFSLGMAAYSYKKELRVDGPEARKFLVWLLIIFIPLVTVCWLEKYYWKTYYILEFICFPLNMFLYTILIAMLFYHSEDIDRKNTLQKRFVLYLGNYSFGIFLIHIFFMYLCTEYLLPLLQISAFDADFLSAAVRFNAGIESWEYGNTGAASFSRAADREG